MAVLSNKPDPLLSANAIRPEIPIGFAGILQNSLSLNADDRPPTANSMREMVRDYENFSHLAKPATVTAARYGSDVFGAKTKLMPSDTTQDVGAQTDVKTVIMPDFVSQETSIRPNMKGGDVGGRSGGRRGRAIAAALAAVLIACGSTAGLYLYDPSIFGDNKGIPAVSVEAAKPEVEPTNTVMVADPDPNPNPDPESSPPPNPNPGSSETRPTSTSRSETVKTQKPPDVSPPDADPNGDIRVHGDTIYMGNVKITPQGVVPNVYVDRSGIKRPIPPPVDSLPFPGITREQFEQMTPHQRQKLIEARRQLQMLERGRQLDPRPSVTPPRP
jgi:hypothetical protein